MRLALAFWLAVAPVGGLAQGLSLGTPVDPGIVQSAILVIDIERVYAESEFGARVLQEIEAEGAQIAAENRAIETELVEEESRLTEQRPTMDPASFRALAQAFDEKVQRLRNAQDEKGRALGERNDAARLRFIEAVQPVLAAMMQEAGASVILERRSVFVAVDMVDVSETAILRINTVLGRGD